MVFIQEAKLRQAVALILEMAGSHHDEAETVTDHLVRANLAGHDSHGVGMLPAYMRALNAGKLVPNQHPQLVKDEGSILMYDGGFGYGQVQAKEAMAAALARCKETGLVLMTLRNAHHIGRIGTYGEQAIAAGFVSLHFVNVTGHPPAVAPFGGREGRFITNPVCLAMPGTVQTKPLLLDMATSKIAMGKARVAMNKQESVPDGSLIDPEGKPTNDPAVLFAEPKGALLPFGDHKGSGLALFCELLAGGLSGGGTAQPDNQPHGAIVNNMFTVVVDPRRMVDPGWLESEINGMVAYVKNAAPDARTERVRVAGEPEREAQEDRQVNGIPLAEQAWRLISEAGESVGVDADALAGIIC